MPEATPAEAPASPLTLGAWAARLALWLPVCFTAWYFGGRLGDGVVTGPARTLVNLLGNGVVLQTELGGTITFVTRIAAGGGVLTVDVDTRLYSWGLALAAAVLLAAWPRGLAWKLGVLLAAMVPVVAWGVAFDVLAQLVRTAPGWSAAVLGGTGTNAVAVGYQFGSLIFPGLVPLGLAVAFAWPRVAAFARPRA